MTYLLVASMTLVPSGRGPRPPYLVTFLMRLPSTNTSPLNILSAFTTVPFLIAKVENNFLNC